MCLFTQASGGKMSERKKKNSENGFNGFVFFCQDQFSKSFITIYSYELFY